MSLPQSRFTASASLVLAFAALTAVSPVGAQVKTVSLGGEQRAFGGGVEPAARELIEQMVEAYRGLSTFSVTLKTSSVGFPLEESTATLDFKAPNRLAIHCFSKSGETSAVSNGTTITIFNPKDSSIIRKLPAPGTLSETLQVMSAAGDLHLGPTSLLLTGVNPLPSPETLKTLSVGSESLVGDTPVQQVTGTVGVSGGQTAKLTYVIGKTDHLLRQSFLLLSSGRAVLSENHTGVKANPYLPDSLFTVTAPASAAKVGGEQTASRAVEPGRKAATASAKAKTGADGLPVSTSQYPDDTVFSNTTMQAGTVRVGGDPIPIDGSDTNGQPIDLNQYRGKVVMLDFWATWCGPCREEVPNVVKMYKKYKDYGFEVVGISLDQDLNRMKAFTKEKGMTWRQYFDGLVWKNKVFGKYQFGGVPATVMIGRDGKITALEAQGESLELYIRQALKRK